MGGVQEHGYTCRLINVRHVKEMCQHFDVVHHVPSNLDALCRNDFPKTRIRRLRVLLAEFSYPATLYLMKVVNFVVGN